MSGMVVARCRAICVPVSLAFDHSVMTGSSSMQGPVGDPGLKGANGDAGAAVCHLLHLIMLFTCAHYFSAEDVIT